MEINTAVRIIRNHIFDYLREMRGGRNAGRTGLIEAANTIYDYTNEKEKYRWHDLRRNRTDLPEEEGDVLIAQLFFDNFPVFKVSSYTKDLYNVSELDFEDRKGIGGFFNYDSEYGYYEEINVVGWKHLKPFEEDKP